MSPGNELNHVWRELEGRRGNGLCWEAFSSKVSHQTFRPVF